MPREKKKSGRQVAVRSLEEQEDRMGEKKETVIASHPFLLDDGRWSGVVEVIEREQTFSDGETRKFSDRRLRIGTRSISLPRRGLGEIIAALQRADADGEKHYAELVARMNQPVHMRR